MKILHIIDTLGPGGAQVLLRDLFEYQQHDSNIHLFCLRKTELITRINHKNIFVYNSFSKYSFKPLFAIKKEVKNNKIDILHCHLFRSQVFGYIVKSLFFPKIKLVFHEHGQILGSETGNKLEDFIFSTFLKFSKRKVCLFVAVSEKVKKSLKSKVKIAENKVKLLYNFINIGLIQSKITEIDKRQNNLTTSESFVLGFAGRIIKGKGWEELINSINFIENKKIKILIAGEGDDSVKLISEIKSKKLSNKVEYLGYVNDIHENFYSKIDCLIIPSHKEALGLVALEAYAHKIPVIASNIEGLNEIVINDKNGLLFKVKSEKDLALKIDKITNNKPLREKLVLQATIDIARFDIVQYLGNLETVYNKL